MNQISADCNINIGGGQSPIDGDVIDDLNIPVLPVFELLQRANEVLSGGPFDYSGNWLTNILVRISLCSIKPALDT